MVPNSRLFKVEYAQELLRLAAEDLRSSQILKDGNARTESALFHVEQAVEKSLKAVLCSKQVPIPLHHDLAAILVLLGDQLPPNSEGLNDLTPYASIRRYEEGVAIINASDVQIAINKAEDVLRWAKELLQVTEKK